MLLVLIAGTAVGTIAFAGVSLSGSVAGNASKGLAAEQGNCILMGAQQLAKSDLIAKKITAGDMKTYTIGGIPVTVTTYDNSSVMPNTVRMTITATTTNGPIAWSSVIAIAKPIVTSIWSHGIFSNNSFTWPASTTVTGSVYFRNSISVQSTGGQVTQDFKTTSLFNPTGLIRVGGGIMTGITPYDFPTLNNNTYLGQASSVLTGNQTLGGYTFPVQNALVVVNGNLTLNNAQITRSGTFYVTGSVTVNKVTRASSSDHIAIITPNNITFSNGSSAVTAEGYFFAGGTITLSSNLNLTGAMIGNAYSGAKPLNITWDSWIMADPANGQTLKVPALWP
ncbi:MAG TPA: hypothetical protein VHE55_18780 [Fimbriimonadaceae bacterium]|nr:hypothetical protein [Fimbriimonadaceae bacterium]